MTPEVSVVMSVYNGGEHLRSTIESVLTQEDVDLELIVVDDGSTDGSAAILESIADPRLRVIRQENRGLTRALIAGCAVARGHCIARQDTGDLSRPLRLAKQKRALDADAAIAFVSCWTDFVGPEDEPLWTAGGTGVAVEARNVLDLTRPNGMLDGPSSHPSVMFRADAYRTAGGYRAEFYYGQDWDLWYRLAAIGRFQMLPESLYVARVDAASISSSAKDAQEALARCSLAAARARAAGESDAEILREAAAIHKGRRPLFAASRGNYFLGQALRRNHDRRARRYFLRAIRTNPFHAKAWVRLAQSLFS